MLAVLADATGRSVDAAHFRGQADNTAAAINALMYDETAGLYCDGVCKPDPVAKWKDNHTQLCQAQLTKDCGERSALLSAGPCEACAAHHKPGLDAAKCTPGTISMLCAGLNRTNHHSIHSAHYPLWLGVVPPERAEKVVAFLAQRNTPFLRGSVYTTFMLLHGLYEHGASDNGVVALKVMTQCSNQSWCNMLRLNATTTWETWSPTDGTHSHPWSGAPASAISGGLIGVRALAPTHERVLISPQLGDGAFTAHATVPTIRGGIEVRATQSASRQMTVEFDAPANLLARVCLPTFGADLTLIVDDEHVRASSEGGYLCADGLGSGRHTVAARKALAGASV